MINIFLQSTYAINATLVAILYPFSSLKKLNANPPSPPLVPIKPNEDVGYIAFHSDMFLNYFSYMLNRLFMQVEPRQIYNIKLTYR